MANIISFDASIPVLPVFDEGTQKYYTVGHGYFQGGLYNLPNVNTTAQWINFAKFTTNPVLFFAWLAVDLPMGRILAACKNQDIDPTLLSAIKILSRELDYIYEIGYSVKDLLPPPKGARGVESTRKVAKNFYLASAVFERILGRIMDISKLDSPLVGSPAYLRNTYPCYAEIAQSWEDGLADSARTPSQEIERLYMENVTQALTPPTTMKDGKAYFSLVQDSFQIPSEEEYEAILADLRLYVQSLKATYPNLADGVYFQEVDGWPNFLTEKLEQGLYESTFERSAKLLKEIVIHLGSQAHMCNRSFAGNLAAFESLNFQSTYAFLLRMRLFDAFKDPLTGRDLIIFSAGTLHVGGFGHANHTQSMQFGYSTPHPNHENQFSNDRCNMLWRCWSSRGANALLYKLGRVDYEAAMRAHVGFFRSLVQRGVIGHLTGEAGRLMLELIDNIAEDDSLDFLAGPISDSLSTFEGNRFLAL